MEAYYWVTGWAAGFAIGLLGGVLLAKWEEDA
jgi:hypothetical protein